MSGSFSPSSRVLVTGARGFVGRHVASAFASGVFGKSEMVEAPSGMDIRNAEHVGAMVEDARPDAIIHLAAQSFVPRSFEDPHETLEINVMGTLNLLEVLQARHFGGRLLYVSSGDVYGLVPEERLPVNEARLPEPRNPYAVSKLAAEQLCLQRHRSSGMDVVIARPFNHVGPGQDARFVLPALASQVVAIASGRCDKAIQAGDLDVTRDFTDVRDVVAAYASLLRAGRPGRTYLVGSGKEQKLRDLLAAMCALKGIDPEIEQDAAKLRPAEQRRMCADSTRIQSDTGWRPAISMARTLADVLKDAEERQ